MFSGCSSLKSLDLSSFDTSRATYANQMFGGCSALETVRLGVKFSFGDLNGGNRFPSEDASGNLIRWKDSAGQIFEASQVPSNVADTYTAVPGGTPTPGWTKADGCEWKVEDGKLTLRPLDGKTSGTLSGRPDWGSDFESFEVEGKVSITDCSQLFADFSGFDTSRATNMEGMFKGRSALETVDLTKLDTSSSTDMSSMFQGCSKLSALDLSKFDTSRVTDMYGMFMGCSS